VGGHVPHGKDAPQQCCNGRMVKRQLWAMVTWDGTAVCEPGHIAAVNDQSTIIAAPSGSGKKLSPFFLSGSTLVGVWRW
jgi:hypothetical protein